MAIFTLGTVAYGLCCQVHKGGLVCAWKLGLCLPFHNWKHGFFSNFLFFAYFKVTSCTSLLVLIFRFVIVMALVMLYLGCLVCYRRFSFWFLGSLFEIFSRCLQAGSFVSLHQLCCIFI